MAHLLMMALHKKRLELFELWLDVEFPFIKVMDDRLQLKVVQIAVFIDLFFEHFELWGLMRLDWDVFNDMWLILIEQGQKFGIFKEINLIFAFIFVNEAFHRVKVLMHELGTAVQVIFIVWSPGSFIIFFGIDGRFGSFVHFADILIWLFLTWTKN